MTQATYRVLLGDAREQLRTLPDGSVQTCITSPPYWGLRSYLDADHPDKPKEIGQEQTPTEYIAHLVTLFREVKRVLRNDGTAWINLGDTYSRGERTKNPRDAERGMNEGSKHQAITAADGYGPGATADRPAKNLLMIPERFALAMQDDGWILRKKIIWHKPNAMPSSVKDRPSPSYEEIFLFSQRPRYYYDRNAIAERAISGDNGSYFDRGKTALHPNQGKDRRDKQSQVGKRQYVGFNARWDAQESAPETRNRRDVWAVEAPAILRIREDLSEIERARALSLIRQYCEPVDDDTDTDIWSVSTSGYPEAHFAVWPEKLVELMVLAGCPEGGTVLEPFTGSGTTLAVANRLGRHAIGLELNDQYLELIERRCAQSAFVFAEG